jgi:uncharacterized protein
MSLIASALRRIAKRFDSSTPPVPPVTPTRVARGDSWLNAWTGVGTQNQRTSFGFVRDARLPDEVLSDIYHGDSFGARICDAIPYHSLRQGFEVTTGDAGLDVELAEKLKTLKVQQRFIEAWTWARVFGGAALLIGADDGRDPTEPLDPSAVRSVGYLTVVTKRELFPSQWYNDPLTTNFGEPSVYRVSRSGGTTVDTREIHATRIIRFDGALTERQRRRENSDWSDSVLQRVYDKLQQFNGAFAATANLLQDASQGIFKINGLYDAMASDADDRFKNRMLAMDMMRGIFRAIMVDKDGEDYTRVAAQMAGVPDVMDKFLLLLAGASNHPVTVLFGQAPAGLNATGESDTRNWYDQLQSERSNTAQPRLERLCGLLVGNRVKVTIKFHPLWQMTDKEQAELRKLVADTDSVYIDKQVVTPEEIATSRFQPDGWSAETTVDIAAREALQESDATEQALQPEPTEQAGVAAATDHEANVQQTALNGAQIASMLQIVQQVSERAIPRETGIALITASFPISREGAEAIMGPVGESFFAQPAATPEPPLPGQNGATG